MKATRLNPLVMGLCFYRPKAAGNVLHSSLNPLVMGLCFYPFFGAHIVDPVS